jgi:hypothetical protein
VTGLARRAGRRQTEGIHSGGRAVKLWRIALACFLLLYALTAITNVRFEMQGFLLGLTALAAAVLLLFDR